ncbi:uncharacterized protein LOC110734925 [Chenopodium quinoa]|uniref:uncharacterized protein LOC110734925 n=1 Tax=Chenopodium quinoa TaxID=63459 RepID=UPI000B76BF6F|nr:uncharacterized protein LOC110734925 [Chenopodium quinoa]
MYVIHEVYDWLHGFGQEVDWKSWVWNQFNSPKHMFISWLAIHNKLKTRDRLERFGICNDNRCLLCGDAIVNRNHLFFECNYSKRCVALIADWLKIRDTSYSIEEIWKQWCKHLKEPIYRKVGMAALSAIVYHIWFARNHVLWQKAVFLPKILCKVICIETVDRCRHLVNCKWDRNHCKWLFSLRASVP